MGDEGVPSLMDGDQGQSEDQEEQDAQFGRLIILGHVGQKQAQGRPREQDGRPEFALALGTSVVVR